MKKLIIFTVIFTHFISTTHLQGSQKKNIKVVAISLSCLENVAVEKKKKKRKKKNNRLKKPTVLSTDLLSRTVPALAQLPSDLNKIITGYLDPILLNPGDDIALLKYEEEDQLTMTPDQVGLLISLTEKFGNNNSRDNKNCVSMTKLDEEQIDALHTFYWSYKSYIRDFFKLCSPLYPCANHIVSLSNTSKMQAHRKKRGKKKQASSSSSSSSMPSSSSGPTTTLNSSDDVD